MELMEAHRAPRGSPAVCSWLACLNYKVCGGLQSLRRSEGSKICSLELPDCRGRLALQESSGESVQKLKRLVEGFCLCRPDSLKTNVGPPIRVAEFADTGVSTRCCRADLSIPRHGIPALCSRNEGGQGKPKANILVAQRYA